MTRVIANRIKLKTPFFIFDKDKVIANLQKLRRYFPSQSEIYYSMKANSELEVLEVLSTRQCGFEVANIHELNLLKRFKIAPEKIIYGSSIKTSESIKTFFKYGVDRFAFDSEQELHKIAENAPGSKVYLRVNVKTGAHSVFNLNKKFGIAKNLALSLAQKAVSLGLEFYGLSFNVGSQSMSSAAWANGIVDLIDLIEDLAQKQIKIDVIDIGGGYPALYKNTQNRITLEEVGNKIKKAVLKLPYKVKIIVEPGRYLVSDSYSLIVSVISSIENSHGNWLHLDAGAYNPLLEAMKFQGAIRYRIEPLMVNSGTNYRDYILTGPTCDDLDVIDEKVSLPIMNEGDRLIVHDVGAYTFPLITKFNSYPIPKKVLLDKYKALKQV